jgi:two-component system, NtrC family, sensor histidine kinase PilS
VRPTAVSSSQKALNAILDPRLLLRWIYIGRLSVASAIFIAALVVWNGADPTATRIAAVAFALAATLTVISAGYSEVLRRPLGSTFMYLQAVFDLCLVTAVVHVTPPNASQQLSQFSALYILVIATASLLLPPGGALLIAALGNVMFFADTMFHGSGLGMSLWLQLAVFGCVALGTAYLSNQLRRHGERSEQLVVGLEQVRLRAEEILRNIPSGVVTIDGYGRLVYANPMAERLLGVQLISQLGQPVLELLARRAGALASALDRCVQSRIRTLRGESVVHADGRDFPIGVTTTYMDDASTSGRTATAIFQDISDQKQTDALRLRAERLEGIAELSASLAHEIKNPLASIRSAVEQLSHMPRETDDERTLAGLVMRESDRLSRLLSDFLDFARVRVSQTLPVNVGEVARDAARLAGAHPDARGGVSVICVVPTDEALMISGDEDLLHRAIFNLTLNAVQASPPGGEVTLEVRLGDIGSRALSSDPDDRCVTVRVTDHGQGIPPEIRDRLFDPFITTKAHGSGLGLAVVHRAIEAHRGLVLVDSESSGTRFTVLLPRASSQLAGAV